MTLLHGEYTLWFIPDPRCNQMHSRRGLLSVPNTWDVISADKRQRMCGVTGASSYERCKYSALSMYHGYFSKHNSRKMPHTDAYRWKQFAELILWPFVFTENIWDRPDIDHGKYFVYMSYGFRYTPLNRVLWVLLQEIPHGKMVLKP